MKNKQKPISLIRLYKLASQFLVEAKVTPNTKNHPMMTMRDYLKYVNEHKNDEL
jgi:hypothetical protein